MTTSSESGSGARSVPPPVPSNFPQYAPPQGIPNFGEKFGGPLTKMLTARAKPRTRSAKGITKSDKIHITKRKQKWY